MHQITEVKGVLKTFLTGEAGDKMRIDHFSQHFNDGGVNMTTLWNSLSP